jgi:hypothetical protein
VSQRNQIQQVMPIAYLLCLLLVIFGGTVAINRAASQPMKHQQFEEIQ